MHWDNKAVAGEMPISNRVDRIHATSHHAIQPIRPPINHQAIADVKVLLCIPKILHEEMTLLCLRLLRNDTIARCRETHIIHLDEGLAVQTQSVDKGLEVAG